MLQTRSRLQRNARLFDGFGERLKAGGRHAGAPLGGYVVLTFCYFGLHLEALNP